MVDRENLAKPGEIMVASLNELAAWHWQGAVLITRRPSTSSFWFFSAAIDSNAIEWARPHLTGEARELLDRGDVGGRYADAIENRNRWCTCDDAEFHSRDYRGPRPEICWPCLFGCHERCSHGCSWEGEIHFPERIYLRSTEAAPAADPVPEQEAPACPAPSSGRSS